MSCSSSPAWQPATLQAWIQTRPTAFNLQQQDENIRTIVKVGLDSNDEALTETATTIISLCIAEGLDLRDLLDGSQ